MSVSFPHVDSSDRCSNIQSTLRKELKVEANTVESDIRYVRGLVDRDGNRAFPGSIYVLWAMLVLAGFSLVDFAPRQTGLFWMIAGPGGGILSGILGRRAGVRMGQLDREEGVRHILHWSGMLLVIVLAVMLAVRGLVQGYVLSQVILLVVSLGWWTAGVHFDRHFLLLGGVMMAGFVGTLFAVPYAWTATGALTSAVLLGIALRRGRGHAAESR
jgi:hypothetical protein